MNTNEMLLNVLAQRDPLSEAREIELCEVLNRFLPGRTVDCSFKSDMCNVLRNAGFFVMLGDIDTSYAASRGVVSLTIGQTCILLDVERPSV